MPALIEVVLVLPVVEIKPSSPSIVKGFISSCAKAAEEADKAISVARSCLFIGNPSGLLSFTVAGQ